MADAAALMEAAAFGVVPVVEVDGVAEADARAETPPGAGLGVIGAMVRISATAEVIARTVQRRLGMAAGACKAIGEQDLPRAVKAALRTARTVRDAA